MSSNEENLQCKQDLKKRRRKQKACDNCRHRKGDGMVMPGKRCSNCITFKLDCVYIDGTQVRITSLIKIAITEATRSRTNTPRRFRYVEDLERKVQEMEKLLLKMLPDGEFDSRFTRGTRPKRWAKVSDSDDDITTEIEKKYLQDPDRVCLEQMTERYKDLTPGYRFFGKSSSAQLVETAVNFKHEYSGNTREPPPFLRWKRPEFWDWKPPYHSSLRNEICDEVYTFPEDDLLRSLVDLYFERINILLPLLHRPTFENLVAEKLHLKDQKFADVVLFVCAVASRYSDDPRVLFEGQHSAQSSGWKWVHQVVSTFRISIRLPTLYDLQFLCLFSQFMLGSSAPRMCWTLAGIGLRLAQDVGVHQRRATDSPNTVEGELWKRAFWCLMFLDRVLSSHLGQSCALYEEETDVELPAECDDQYWICANPEEAFKQPAGQPSDISYFNTSLRLSNLLQNCLRTLYLMKKAKLSFGFLRQGWDLQAATKLDASLDSWFDSIPEHLRWNPNQENPIHFNQSALLHILYFHLRILIHRPFIASSNDTIPLHVHSLVICTNAARSCSFIVDAQRIRGYLYPISGFIAFNAGVILLFNIWYRKHFDHSFDASHDIDNVHKYMKMLEHLNARYVHHPPRYHQTLTHMIAGLLPALFGIGSFLHWHDAC
ncbi:fungal-specific transcription factor domain-containing protein [Desarmillaria ectypa]|nr:fungal-specific transcription factor domain-containing protein [Desarmillaria ectypa]